MKKRRERGWFECVQLKELVFLRQITPHPNIICLYHAFLIPDTKELHLVFECMEGNLYQLIKSRKGKPPRWGFDVKHLSPGRFEFDPLSRQRVLSSRHESGEPARHNHWPRRLFSHLTSPLVCGDSATAPPEKNVMVIINLAALGL